MEGGSAKGAIAHWQLFRYLKQYFNNLAKWQIIQNGPEILKDLSINILHVNGLSINITTINKVSFECTRKAHTEAA